MCCRRRGTQGSVRSWSHTALDRLCLHACVSSQRWRRAAAINTRQEWHPTTTTAAATAASSGHCHTSNHPKVRSRAVETLFLQLCHCLQGKASSGTTSASICTTPPPSRPQHSLPTSFGPRLQTAPRPKIAPVEQPSRLSREASVCHAPPQAPINPTRHHHQQPTRVYSCQMTLRAKLLATTATRCPTLLPHLLLWHTCALLLEHEMMTSECCHSPTPPSTLPTQTQLSHCTMQHPECRVGVCLFSPARGRLGAILPPSCRLEGTQCYSGCLCTLAKSHAALPPRQCCAALQWSPSQQAGSVGHAPTDRGIGL